MISVETKDAYFHEEVKARLQSGASEVCFSDKWAYLRSALMKGLM